jgi:hypothetical protein
MGYPPGPAMRVHLSPAPWTKARPNAKLASLATILDGIWVDTAETFFAEIVAARNTGSKHPKGMQRLLNQAIDARMQEAGWEGEEGRFVNGNAWVRFTFRHQMGLGSDILDALRVHRLENIAQCAIVCAPRQLLDVISPNDASILCSTEKLAVKLRELDGALEFPLFAGRFEPTSELPREVQQILASPRPRGSTKE